MEKTWEFNANLFVAAESIGLFSSDFTFVDSAEANNPDNIRIRFDEQEQDWAAFAGFGNEYKANFSFHPNTSRGRDMETTLNMLETLNGFASKKPGETFCEGFEVACDEYSSIWEFDQDGKNPVYIGHLSSSWNRDGLPLKTWNIPDGQGSTTEFENLPTYTLEKYDFPLADLLDKVFN